MEISATTTSKGETSINVDAGTCTGNKLIISEGDIIITPTDETSGATDRDQGCIYVSKGNIQILGGAHRSITETTYDYLEGFLMAEKQIQIVAADENEPIRDGLEIKGSL